MGASLLLPEDREVPLIFACTGTGVAPLRSFMRRIAFEGRPGLSTTLLLILLTYYSVLGPPL